MLSGCLILSSDGMLRIQRSANGEVVFTLSGQMDEDVAELETLISSEANVPYSLGPKRRNAGE